MSFVKQRDMLLRDDPALPEDLRRAFVAYGGIAPPVEVSAQLLGSLERSLATARPAPRRGTHWALAAVGLLSLAVVGLLGWLSASGAPSPSPRPSAASAGASSGVHRVPAARVATAPRPSPLRASEPTQAASTNQARAPRALPSPAALPSGGKAARARELDPVQELALLARAKRVLARDPLEALALTQAHARQFPRGTFAEEREVIAIEALMRNGKRDRASTRAATFRAAYPRSTHLDRIRVILSEP